ncbi:MAG: SDR family oxidoreductase [Bacteroidia bacterium]|nr:SDR family oxidoreductase [Bacteroidia bacterium]
MYDLTGKQILVTGASKGIGKAIARQLLRQGAHIGLHYNRSAQGVEELIEEFGAERTLPIQADLEERKHTEALFQVALKQMKNIESVVLNAGIFEPHFIDDPLDSWLKVWQRTIKINLESAGILTKLFLEHFQKKKQGRLIYISSRAALRGETEEYLAYAASKGGLSSLAKTVARSFGKYNIKAFVVAPGFIKTDMAMEAISKIGEEKVLDELALNRLTTPEDIAPLVALLCSGQLDHSTGTTIDINAGSHIR